MAKLDDILLEVKSELGADFIASGIVSMRDGMTISDTKQYSQFDIQTYSARYTMVVQLSQKVAGKTHMGKLEDLLTTTDNAYLLNRLLGDGSYFWGLGVTQNATLGIVRVIMNEYANQLWEAIPR